MYRLARLIVFVIIVLAVLAASTALVLSLVTLANEYGYVRNPQFDVSSSAIVAAILGLAGLIGVIVAYDKNNIDARALRARFAFDINQQFFRDQSEREFFYKIEHEQFFFNPITFPRSDDERELDRILYRLSLVGKLLRDDVLDIGDIQFMKHIARSVLINPEVQNYLQWLKREVPDHASFVNAIYLYKRAFSSHDEHFLRLKHYLS